MASAKRKSPVRRLGSLKKVEEGFGIPSTQFQVPLPGPSARLQWGFALPRQLFPELPGPRSNVRRVASPSFGSFFADFAAHSLIQEKAWRAPSQVSGLSLRAADNGHCQRPTHDSNELSCCQPPQESGHLPRPWPPRDSNPPFRSLWNGCAPSAGRLPGET